MGEILTTRLEFGCACAHKDRQVCYAIRYPNKNPMEWTALDVCECPCHDRYDDDCDCHECNDEVII